MRYINHEEMLEQGETKHWCLYHSTRHTRHPAFGQTSHTYLVICLAAGILTARFLRRKCSPVYDDEVSKL